MTTKPKSKKQLHIAGKGPFGSFVAKQKNRKERFKRYLIFAEGCAKKVRGISG
jgi:hypothetical protein